MTHASFFFHDPATTEIYTLSLHDALPILRRRRAHQRQRYRGARHQPAVGLALRRFDLRDRHRRLPDRKSTRLNSSHSSISYAVFCLKKKKEHAFCWHIRELERGDVYHEVL